jgi:predicted dienelactone hydrolase
MSALDTTRGPGTSASAAGGAPGEALRPARRAPALAIAALTLLAGCGGDDGQPPGGGDPACEGWGDAPVDAGLLELPRPTGPHPIGTQTRAFTDPARGEEASDDPDDRRAFVMQLWYPADPCGVGDAAPYLLPAEGDARRAGTPIEDGFEAKVVTHARIDVPIAGEGAPHPVLLFSHGFGMLRGDYASLLEDLASHGFVVAALSHTFDSALTVFPDGREVPFDSAVPVPAPDAPPEEIEAFMEAMDQHIAVWVDDARFVLEELTAFAQDDPEGLLTGRLDLDRVGILGHSYGGATAAEACAIDDRFDAGLDLDGTLFGPMNGSGGRSLVQPFLVMLAEGHLGNDPSIDETYAALQGPGYLAEVAGAAHLTFSDLPVVIDHFVGTGGLEELLGTIAPDRAVEIMNAYTRAFVQAHVLGEAAPLLDGPSADFPEVAFQKKP